MSKQTGPLVITASPRKSPAQKKLAIRLYSVDLTKYRMVQKINKLNSGSIIPDLK